MTTETPPVTLKRDEDGVAFMVIDNPPVNVISQAVRQGIIDQVAAVRADPAIAAVVMMCAGRTFIAGADIQEFGKPPAPPHLPDVIDQLEALDVPLVAAIHGAALGGGFEIALGCHYRLAVSGAKVGMPEVNVGVIPGAGGCYRLPRLVGVDAALSMITGGAPISAEKARELGAIDEVVEGDLSQAAKAFALSVVREGRGVRRASGLSDMIAEIDPACFDVWRKALSRTRRKQMAPARAVDAVEAGVREPIEKAKIICRQIFLEVRESREARALRHIFFAERAASATSQLGSVPSPEVKTVAVVGAGAMGAGIAMCFANAGIPVTLLDTSQENVERGLASIRRNYGLSVSKRKMSERAVAECMGLIRGGVEYSDIGDVDLAIEAVFEDLEIKKQVFRQLDAVCRDNAILATNTSYLNINEIAGATNRPENVIGMHFFNPAHIMKLLEIIRCENTSDEVLRSCLEVSRRLRKTGVVSGVCFGFIGNRMLNAYRTEALNIALEGASVYAIDAALHDFGMPMGPFALMDLTGLEVNVRMRAHAGPADIDARAFRIVDRLYAMGRFGQNSGAGFYKYENGEGSPVYDPSVDAWIAEEAARSGIKRRSEISPAEIAERCIHILINQGAHILDEAIAQRAGDIDVAYVAGYGFPRHLGGPMFWAAQEGLPAVLNRIEAHANQSGRVLWRPSALLVRAVEKGVTLDDARAFKGRS